MKIATAICRPVLRSENMLFEADKVMFEIYRETEYTGKYRVCYFTELQDHNKESEINHALSEHQRNAVFRLRLRVCGFAIRRVECGHYVAAAAGGEPEGVGVRL